ncbi:MAG TPA: M23 family metallopeptidase [Candidatus Binatia bacterium]|nr:M23 family metallopeptidase [Candidatus Binatia bacterium]
MTRAERIRRFPKTGWRNLLARHLAALKTTPAPSKFLDYQAKTTFSLPFAGEWYVYWGGRTVAENKHAAAIDQRFAYDFLILAHGRTGQSYRNSGTEKSDYYCFGQPVYAPADGGVVETQNDLPDNMPGEMNSQQPLGNHVILDHGHNEFTFLAHFQFGSVAVVAGDHVIAGQFIGRCGNSGNSSEPHLHFHVQNSAIPFRGEGLPAFFTNYFLDGKPVASGEPVARHTVRSQRELSR